MKLAISRFNRAYGGFPFDQKFPSEETENFHELNFRNLGIPREVAQIFLEIEITGIIFYFGLCKQTRTWNKFACKIVTINREMIFHSAFNLFVTSNRKVWLSRKPRKPRPLPNFYALTNTLLIIIQ